MPTPTLELALHLAAIGRHVFPLAGANKRPLPNCPACRESAGHAPHRIDQCPCLPRGGWCHGVRAATTNPDTITGWFAHQPAALVALAAGPSGLVLIDIDTHHAKHPADPARELLPGIDLTRERHVPEGWHELSRYRDGRDALRLLTAIRGGPRPWPSGPQYQPATVDTPSGGRHLWYRAPADNLHQAVHPYGLAWQVDIKAGWSYGLAPGNHTPSGEYRLTGGDLAHPGTPPPWLAREIIRRAAPTPPPRPRLDIRPVRGTGPAAYVDTLIRNGAESIRRENPKDGRKAALAALAYKTGGFLHWAGLTEADVIDQLVSAGTSVGLTHAIAHRTARRSLANGATQPITPHT